MNRVNYSALCRKYKINYNTFIWRIKRKGMSVDEALQTAVTPKVNKSIKKIAEKSSVKYGTIVSRIRNQGMTVEEASSIPAWGITGKKYKGVCLWRYCKEHNIKYNRVRSRLLSGWTMEDAVNKPLQKRGRKAKKSVEFVK